MDQPPLLNGSRVDTLRRRSLRGTVWPRSLLLPLPVKPEGSDCTLTGCNSIPKPVLSRSRFNNFLINMFPSPGIEFDDHFSTLNKVSTTIIQVLKAKTVIFSLYV